MTTEETSTMDNRYAMARRLIEAEFPGMEPEYITVYALLLLIFGEDVESWQIHDGWGVVRVVSAPDHRDLVDFPELPQATQAYDDRFRDGVRRAAAKLRAVA